MRLNLISILLLRLLTALPTLAVPNPCNQDLVSLAKRQTDPEDPPGTTDTCTDICTANTDCIEICSPPTEAADRVCTQCCQNRNYNIKARRDICLTVGPDLNLPPSSTDEKTGTAVILDNASFSAEGDININISRRSTDGVVMVYVRDVVLKAGGRIRINSGDGPRCIGNDCKVILYAKNVRFTSALTGGQERHAIEEVYNSELDGTLVWQ